MLEGRSPEVAFPAVPRGGAKRSSGWANRLPLGRNKEVADNEGLAVAAYECDERSARLWSWRLDRAQ